MKIELFTDINALGGEFDETRTWAVKIELKCRSRSDEDEPLSHKVISITNKFRKVMHRIADKKFSPMNNHYWKEDRIELAQSAAHMMLEGMRFAATLTEYDTIYYINDDRDLLFFYTQGAINSVHATLDEFREELDKFRDQVRVLDVMTS